MPRVINRQLTKPSDPERLTYFGQLIVAILLLIIPGFLYASQRARLHENRGQIAALESRLADLDERRGQLLIERAVELDPWRLQHKARELAGLGEPLPEQVASLGRPQSGGERLLLTSGGGRGPDGHP